MHLPSQLLCLALTAAILAACTSQPERPKHKTRAATRRVPTRRAMARAPVALLSFAEEEVELSLLVASRTLEVRARYVFANSGGRTWVGPIIYPIYVTPTQKPPPHIVLADGSRRDVRCGKRRPDACAAAVSLAVPPGSWRELVLRYTQPMPTAKGPAVYMLTSGATWSDPIGRALLRVLVPRGDRPEFSYPMAYAGALRRDGRSFDAYTFEAQRFVPAEELRVALR